MHMWVCDVRVCECAVSERTRAGLVSLCASSLCPCAVVSLYVCVCVGDCVYVENALITQIQMRMQIQQQQQQQM